MKRNLLIRGARQLLTLHSQSSGPRRGESLKDLGIIEDGSILIVDGVIANVGPTRRVENLAEARTAEEINASGRVVLPGFSDAWANVFGVPGRLLHHRFLGERRYRSGEEMSAPEQAATVNYLRTAVGNALEFQAARHLETFLRHGTTSVAARTGFGLPAPGEMKMVRALSNLDGKCVNVVSTYLAGHTPGLDSLGGGAHVEWLCREMIPRLADRRSARFVGAVCGDEGLSGSEAMAVLEAARRIAMPVRVVAAGRAPSEAIRVAVESDAVDIAGLTSATAEDAGRLGQSRTMATLLPGRLSDDEMQGGDLARRLISAGVAISLGSGFEPSACSTLNMQMVISRACTRMNLTPEEAISAATINSAHALGLGGRCGSLEFSKNADICILDVSDYREIPLYFGMNLVSTIIRKGAIAWQAGAAMCSED